MLEAIETKSGRIIIGNGFECLRVLRSIIKKDIAPYVFSDFPQVGYYPICGFPKTYGIGILWNECSKRYEAEWLTVDDICWYLHHEPEFE